MNRSYVLPLTFIACIALLFSLSLQSAATTFSGRVVDEAGKPVSGVELALPGFRVTTPQDQDEPVFLPSQQTETNYVGEFLIGEITSPSVQLVLLPFRAAAYEIRAAKIEGISFYIDENRGRYGGLTFAITPGADVKDVKITVRPRMRIRGRVLSADGTPLRNERVGFRIERRKIEGRGGGGGGGTRDLDADGYFVEYVERPAYYTVSVEYNDLSAGAGPFLLKDGVQPEEIILTLEGKPDPVEPPADDIPVPGNIRFRQPPTPPPAKSVWIINPTNGHAYKKIRCEDWQDAQRKAVEDGNSELEASIAKSNHRR